MSNTIQSKPQRKIQTNSVVQLPPTRNTLSINKIPPSAISNGNASLSKLHKNTITKVQLNQGIFNRTGGGTSIPKGGGKEADMKDKVDKISYGGWMRGSGEDRRQLAWGTSNKQSKENLPHPDQIPKDEPIARQPKTMSKFGRTGYFQQTNNHSSTLNLHHKNQTQKSKLISQKYEKMYGATFAENDKQKEKQRQRQKQKELQKIRQRQRERDKQNRNEAERKKSTLKQPNNQRQRPSTTQYLPVSLLTLKPSSYTFTTTGLNNIGNTCYMNSILQCMVNLPHFNDHFLQIAKKEVLPHARVGPAYYKLLQMIRSGRSKSQNPADLKLAVSAKKHRFSGYSQQDAQQFLTALLQLLSIDMNRSKAPKYQQLTADLTKNTLQQISQQWWNYSKSRQNSIICDYFTGQLLSKVTCSKCRNQSIAFDQCWQYALNLTSQSTDVMKLLQKFLQVETINSDYYCSKCKDFHQAQRKLDFYRLPPILVLQLKRFHYGKHTKRKLNTKVSIKSKIDLSSLLTHNTHKQANAQYRLVGMVHHNGDIDFGHYTAQCFNCNNGKWYLFNDANVGESRLGEQWQSNSPYLLFYVKMS